MKKLLLYFFLLTITFVNAQNDNCSGAIPLTVGASFSAGAVTSSNVGSTIDGTLPSCNSDAVDNVWFTVVVPASGNVTIEIREAAGSSFDDSVLTVYTGTCGSLNEIACNDDTNADLFSLVSLTGQTPGATLYVSAWKYDSTVDSGNFQISAYELISTNNICSQAIPLTIGTDFASGSIVTNNGGATTDGTVPSCNGDAVDNIWFSVVVPASGNVTIETNEVSGSPFDDSVLTVYSGSCGTLTEIACNDDGGDGFFSLVTLTGQTPGSTLYVSAWKYDSSISIGEFQISAYDSTVLSTNETTKKIDKLKVSPNPFSDFITISDISDVKSISVIDISGRLVKKIEKVSSSIYLGDLKEGVYLISLKLNDGTTKTIKAIKK
jgi:hypothetical protein